MALVSATCWRWELKGRCHWIRVLFFPLKHVVWELHTTSSTFPSQHDVPFLNPRLLHVTVCTQGHAPEHWRSTETERGREEGRETDSILDANWHCCGELLSYGMEMYKALLHPCSDLASLILCISHSYCEFMCVVACQVQKEQFLNLIWAIDHSVRLE